MKQPPFLNYSISGRSVILSGLNIPQEDILLISDVSNGGIAYTFKAGNVNYTQGVNSVLTLNGTGVLGPKLHIEYDDGVANNFPSGINILNLPETQGISGAVEILNPVTSFGITGVPTVDANVTFPETQGISGAVLVLNPVTSFALTGTPTVNANVSFPVIQGVSGGISILNLPATQGISGSVSILNPVTNVGITGTPTVNANVTFPATQAVSGGLSILNFPATQGVSGSVSILNPITNVGITGTPTVNANVIFPTTQGVSGELSILNFPATQGVSGSISILNPVTSFGITGTPTVNANVTFPVTQGVSGSVTITNPVTTLAVSNLPSGVGSATKAASLPVVLATDQLTPQSPLPIILSPQTVTNYTTTGGTTAVQVTPGAWYAISVGKAYTANTITGTYSGASGATTLTTASTTGVAVGQQVVGTSIPKGAVVTAVVTNTSITISLPITALISAATLTFTSESLAFVIQYSLDGSTGWTNLNSSLQSNPSLQAPTAIQYYAGIYLVQAPASTSGTVYLRFNFTTMTNCVVNAFIDPFVIGSKLRLPYNIAQGGTINNFWPAGACAIPVIDTSFIQGFVYDISTFSGSSNQINWASSNDPNLASPKTTYHTQMDLSNSPVFSYTYSQGVYLIQNKLRYFYAYTSGTITSWVVGGLTAIVSSTDTSTVTQQTITANSSLIGGVTPLMSLVNGSGNRALASTIGTCTNNLDQNNTAFNGSGRVVGSLVGSSAGAGVSISADINITALTLGTATAVIPILQESYDNSNTIFNDIWVGLPMTTVSRQRMPAIPIQGRRRWCLHSVGGTSTTVTATITAMELPGVNILQRQLVDVYNATNAFATVINGTTYTSTLVSTTLSSTSSILIVEGCCSITISGVFTGGTPTTAPVYTLQLSNDLTNWVTTSCTMSPTAAGTFYGSYAGAMFRYAQLIITTASAGGTPYGVTYTAINGYQGETAPSSQIVTNPSIVSQTYSGSGVITINTVLVGPIDCSQYRSVALQCTSMGASGVVTPEVSNDGGTTWVGITLVGVTASAAGTFFNGAGAFEIGLSGFKLFRLRLSTATTSGNTNIYCFLSQQEMATKIVYLGQNSVTASLAGNSVITPVPITGQGFSLFHTLIAAGSTNATSVKASVGVLGTCYLTNNAASVRYVKFFNLAVAPTVGTSTPVIQFAIQPNSSINVETAFAGMRFSTGIAYCITTGSALLDATAVTAGDVLVNLTYL